MMSAAWPRKSIVKNPRTSGGYTYFPLLEMNFKDSIWCTQLHIHIEESTRNHF